MSEPEPAAGPKGGTHGTLPAWRALALACGLCVLAALWLGPLPAMSRTAFSPHMILHLGLVTVASPLIALGIAPWVVASARFRDAISWALLASLFEMVVVWGWHVPLLHALAARHDTVFILQQASFLAAGLAVWTAAASARSRAAIASGGIALFLTFMHMSMFGLLITLAPRLIYEPDLCLGAFGLSSLDDQRFGGILMAVTGGMPYLLGAAIAGYCFIREDPQMNDGALSAFRANS